MRIRVLVAAAIVVAPLLVSGAAASAAPPAPAPGVPVVNGVLTGDRADTDSPRPDKIAALDSLRASRAKGKSAGTVTTSYSAGNKTISVTVQQQSTSYYCVPASTRLTISAFTSSLPSQGTLAGKLGTTTSGTYMSNVPAVLNSYQSRNYYIFSSTSTLDLFRDRIQIDIQNYTAPLENQVQMSLLPWYAGTLSGNHAIATYGYYYATKVSQAYVYDPWTDSRAGRKTVYTSDLYDAGSPYSHNLVW